MSMVSRTPSIEPPTHQEIATLAYQLWEKEGRPAGRDREHWQRAEKELLALHLQEERALRHWERSAGLRGIGRGPESRRTRAARLEQQHLGRQQDRGECLGSHLRALAPEHGTPDEHQQWCCTRRSHPARGRPHQAEGGERGEPAPGEQSERAARFPERPQEHSEQPRRQYVRGTERGPCPDLRGGDGVRRRGCRLW